ncbi:hypothetical protein J11TS1_00120 [Oceanobacillus sp. J11TS1]|nr:hypothetical protein J11TS1_00120 [Oceanobacillus sp. J11TS1]
MNGKNLPLHLNKLSNYHVLSFETGTVNTQIQKGLLKTLQPIILIGHFYSGLCTQHFSKLYSNRIGGYDIGFPLC